MENRVLNLTYASSLSNLCEINPSFDTGVLRIAYHGENRNGSYISKETFERCSRTMYNCPVVCNYDRDTDTLGGHDMALITREADGRLILVNLTTPVGVVPENSQWFWEEVEEADGTVNEYFCTSILLWKRQEAYDKIKRDGIVAHSMEITVNDGKMIDGVYHINDFTFTAFALIGVEPCFMSASLDTMPDTTAFAAQNNQEFKAQMSEMMREIKENFSTIETSNKGDDDTQKDTRGGKPKLDKKNELVAKYGIDVEALDFSIDDFTVEELEEKFAAMQKPEDPSGNTGAKKSTNDDESGAKYTLSSNFEKELYKSVSAEKEYVDWLEMDVPRYCIIDYDVSAGEVYCYDHKDGIICGFTFTMNGDRVEVDFASKKRKKYEIVDFDEGDRPTPFDPSFELVKQGAEKYGELKEKYQAASDELDSLRSEVTELREFKANADAESAANDIAELLARFEDLNGIEAFETLKADCAEYDLETLEEKCFAIRGRQVPVAKFTLEPTKSVKMAVVKGGHGNHKKAPYGGIFEKYGFSEND